MPTALRLKQHTRTDEEGYIEKLHITPANTHECNHLSPLLEGIAEGTTVYADKGYDSAENRQHLKEHYPNLYLIGTPFDGIGIPDGVKQAKELVQRLSR